MRGMNRMSDEFLRLFDYMSIVEHSWVSQKTKTETINSIERAVKGQKRLY